MIRYDRRVWVLSACLAALAGFVDAIGFMELGGFFVSFMTGNTTRLAVGASLDLADMLLAAGLIALFVIGVVLGTIASRRHAIVSLFLLTLLLAGASLAQHFELVAGAITLVVLAMGVENTVFQRDGEVTIGLTYVTGTLVKLGQRLATAFLGGSKTAWFPYGLLWLGLATGAGLGAFVYVHIGLNALWIATAVAAALTAWSWATGLPDRRKADLPLGPDPSRG